MSFGVCGVSPLPGPAPRRRAGRRGLPPCRAALGPSPPPGRAQGSEGQHRLRSCFLLDFRLSPRPARLRGRKAAGGRAGAASCPCGCRAVRREGLRAAGPGVPAVRWVNAGAPRAAAARRTRLPCGSGRAEGRGAEGCSAQGAACRGGREGRGSSPGLRRASCSKSRRV